MSVRVRILFAFNLLNARSKSGQVSISLQMRGEVDL